MKTIPGIGLLLTHNNMYSAFGVIFVTKRRLRRADAKLESGSLHIG